MGEVFVEFDTVVSGPDGRRWIPRACGGVADDGLWEGWIEFTPASSDDAAEPVRTGRETEQPNHADLAYWAQGLTQVYLEDALRRAIDGPAHRPPPRTVTAAFRGPASRPEVPTPAPARSPHPVLDPFAVYQQGEDVLVRELSALETPRLRDIAVAYGFSNATAAADAGREQLVASIVVGVRRPAPAHEIRMPADGG